MSIAFAFHETPYEIASFMVSLISANKDITVLDTGAGTGVFIEALLQADYTYVKAIEINPDFCQTIKTKYPNITVINDNFLTCSLPQVDCIIGNPPYIKYQKLDNENKKNCFLYVQKQKR